MDQASTDVLRRQLGPGERLLWSGVPRQGVTLRPSDALAIPFSLLWGGFAFFWEYSVLSEGGPAFFGIWGLPFIAIGLYMIIGRFFADAYLRGKTAYGLTDDRVIIVGGLFSVEIKSLQLATLSDMTLSERPDATGTIQFGPNPPGRNAFPGTPWPGRQGQMAPAFDLIPHARKVYDLIVRTQQERR
ncbi:hypothetical protein KPL74_13615 [Bacillus sp. NP157]|nr:hypothetical protein KPL74_13615 [Bacillus sp. NP157]